MSYNIQLFFTILFIAHSILAHSFSYIVLSVLAWEIRELLLRSVCCTHFTSIVCLSLCMHGHVSLCDRYDTL